MTFPAWVKFVLALAIAGIEYTQHYEGMTFVEPVPFVLGLVQVVIGAALAFQQQVVTTTRRMLGRPG